MAVENTALFAAFGISKAQKLLLEMGTMNARRRGVRSASSRTFV
jgi:hypothetical protein